MNDAMYKIKTATGYYFTEANGRYGRFYGERYQGEFLCERHANIIIAFYDDEAEKRNESRNADKIPVIGGTCAACARDRHNAGIANRRDGLITR